jgi:septal ring factor EnvC (AmiA/AmiB activator)
MTTRAFFISTAKAKEIAMHSEVFAKERAKNLLIKKRNAQKLLANTSRQNFASKEALIRKAQTNTKMLQAQLQAARLSMNEIMEEFHIPLNHRTFLRKLAEKIERGEFSKNPEKAKKAREEMQRAVELILNNSTEAHPFVMHFEHARIVNRQLLREYFPKPQTKE